jgi:hypothetical protein
VSDYQCYEFRAIDRALSLADKQEIKSISTRAQITDRSFVNHDEIGDVNQVRHLGVHGTVVRSPALLRQLGHAAADDPPDQQSVP